MRIIFLVLTSSFLITSCAQPTRVARDVPHDEPSLVVMTYNVNFGVAGDADTIAAIRDSGADLILLQETTPKWQRYLSELRDIYPHMDFHHCCGAGGLAYLSKHPIVDHAVLEPPEKGWFPAWVVVVDTPLGKIQTLNVHLRPPFSDTGSVVSGYFVTPKIRRSEIEEYVERLDEELPTIVAGDFNEDTGGKAMSFLQARGLTSVLPEFHPDADTWGWNTSVGRVESRLDHIAYDPRLEPIDAEVRPLGHSDHRPVLATFVRAESPR